MVDFNMTVEAVAKAVDENRLPIYEVEREGSQRIRGGWLHGMRKNELAFYKRNRCLELHQRGGRVNESFL